MADYSQSIGDTLTLFGIDPASLWGVMTWGQNWGAGSNPLPTDLVQGENTFGSLSADDTGGYTFTMVTAVDAYGTLNPDDTGGYYFDVVTSVDPYGTLTPSDTGGYFFSYDTGNEPYGSISAVDTNGYVFDVETPASETITLSDAYTYDVSDILCTDTWTLTGLGSSETLQDGAGYYYGFTLPTTNAEDRNQSTYTPGSTNGTSWAAASAAGGTWS